MVSEIEKKLKEKFESALKGNSPVKKLKCK